MEYLPSVKERFCNKVKGLLFVIVDKCNSKKQKELIVQDFEQNIHNQMEHQRIISLEEMLRLEIEKVTLENHNLKFTLGEILHLYRVEDYDSLNHKLRELLRQID